MPDPITLGLGRVTLRLEDGQGLLTPRVRHWQSYRIPTGSAVPDCVIRLRQETLPCPDGPEEGWIPLPGEERAVVYNRAGQPLMMLRLTDGAVDACVSGTSALRPALQFGMLTALTRRCVGLHGATLLCGNEIVILSAPSGTGKTTLAQLLETYGDAILINGDFAMLSVTDEGAVFEPTPFCGTSGRCLNQRVPVHRIVFLEQAPENRWRALLPRETLVRLMTNSFVPDWDGVLQQNVQEQVTRLAARVKVNSFGFVPDPSAAELFCRRLNDENPCENQ